MGESGTDEEGCTACQESEEQEQDERVLLMEEVVGQSCDSSIQTTTGIAGINSSKAIGNVNTQKPVTEADGCSAESWKSTEEGYEGEERDDDHQDDGVTEGDHGFLQSRLILSTPREWLSWIWSVGQQGRDDWHVMQPKMESCDFACRRVVPVKVTELTTFLAAILCLNAIQNYANMALDETDTE